MELIPTASITALTSNFFGVIGSNIDQVLVVLGIIVGVSFVMAFLGEVLKIGGNHGTYTGVATGKKYRF